MPQTSDVTPLSFAVPNEALARFSASLHRVDDISGTLLSTTYPNYPEAQKLLDSVRLCTAKKNNSLKSMREGSEENIRKLAELVTHISQTPETEEATQALVSQVNDTICFVRERACTRRRAQFDSIKKDLAKIEGHMTSIATEKLSQKLSALEEAASETSDVRQIANDSIDLVELGEGGEGGILALIISVLSLKGNRKVDKTITSIKKMQQDCKEESEIVKKTHDGVKNIWTELDEIDEWWLTMDMMLHLPDLPLVEMVRTGSSPKHVKSDLVARCMAIMNAEGKFRDVLKSLQAPSFPTVYLEDLNSERNLNGEVQVFEEKIRHLVPLLLKLSTARHTLRQNQGSFVTKIHELQTCLLKQLCAIQDVFEKWRFFLKQTPTDSLNFVPQISSMMDSNDAFIWEIQPTLIEISSILGVSSATHYRMRTSQTKRRAIKAGLVSWKARTRIGPKSEVLQSWDQLGEILQGITRFTTRLGTALLHHDRRPRGTGHLNWATDEDLETSSAPKDPFDVEQDVIDKALSTLKQETTKLDVNFQPSIFKRVT